MIHWQWPEPVVEHRPAWDIRQTGTHLRGRVTVSRWPGGEAFYVMSVVNTTTGETVMSDNGCVGFEHAFEHAEFHTAAARCTWTTDVRQRQLRRRTRATA